MSFLQILFFATPIIWPIESLPSDMHYLADINPVFAAIDVIRAPLLNIAVRPNSWPLLIGMTIVGCAIAFPVFVRFRSRIAYWI